jgi:hypothetical protein
VIGQEHQRRVDLRILESFTLPNITKNPVSSDYCRLEPMNLSDTIIL